LEIYYVIGLVLLLGGCILSFSFGKKYVEKKTGSVDELGKKIIAEAKKSADIIKKEAMLQAKEKFYQTKSEFEKETKETRQELQSLERRLVSKEENFDKKTDLLDKKELDILNREKSISSRERVVEDKIKRYDSLLETQREQLEQISKLTADEAKDMLVKSMEEEAKHEVAKYIKKVETEAKEVADKKAKSIIATAIQRYAGEFVAERTVSVINLPNDEMKGRIIGREGRNIRSIEAVTGVDLIIDDTPEAVIISSYDPVRREVARITLERLINDGRIHPARIEEITQRARQEIDQAIKEAGEQAIFDTGVHGINPEIIKLIGRLKYRTSYAQNVLQHSLEVGFLCGIMAAELGVNVKQAKRAGLLHDIGKAVDHEMEGSHATIGADLARKYGESGKIVSAIAAHHEDVKPNSILDVLVQAADAISAARPGARKEMLETYIKRLNDLENIANSFMGVTKTYAIQAGREIRILVENEEVSDEASVILARDIAKKVEEELTYPGQIKVTVIRETRIVDYAK
jgi:ribonuclease Y